MPTREELTWRQLRVGLVVGAGLIVTMAAIFLLSGEVGIIGGHYRLTAYLPGAQGLRGGAEVDLAGVPVGNVSRIFLSSSENPQDAVGVVMYIRRKYMNDIRKDSVAEISTQGLLGQSFVNISRGGPGEPPLGNGGVITGSMGTDIKAVTNNANDVLVNLRQLSAQLTNISQQITSGKGTIGKFIYDASLYNKVNDTVSKMQTLMTGISKGRGTLGQLVASQELYNKLNSTIDRANRLLNQVRNGHGTLARLINDPSLYDNLNHDLVQAKTLMTGINAGHGTLGKLVSDPQLYNTLNSTADNIHTLTNRMVEGKGSLGLLSTNTKLYDNLSKSAQALQEFLIEFRKNPKKYLTVRVRLF